MLSFTACVPTNIESARNNKVSELNINTFTSITWKSCGEIEVYSDCEDSACDSEKCCVWSCFGGSNHYVECCYIGE